MEKRYVPVKEKRRKTFLWVFFAIIVFVAFFSIFGGTLRYQTGQMIEGSYLVLGKWLWTFGLWMTVFGFMVLFCAKNLKAFAFLVPGMVLIYISTTMIGYNPFFDMLLPTNNPGYM